MSNVRSLFACLLICAAFVTSPGGAQSPAGTVIAPDPAAPKPPSTAPAQPETPAKEKTPAATETPPRALQSEPPSVVETRPMVVQTTPASPGSPLEQLTPERLLEDVKITDIALVFFALLVALFAFRVGSAVKRVGAAAAHGPTEDSRRAIEAAERAAEAARRSAEAAEHTLATMRDPAERQLRAYVTVRQFMQVPAQDERSVSGWYLQVAWQNSGATPTQGFRYWAMLREFDAAIAEDFEFTPAGLKDFAGGELGPGATINSPPLYLSPDLIDAIRNGSRKVLLLGQADYSDVLGNNTKRETRFCVELVLMKDPSGAEGVPFSFIYYPKHNYIT
jgi:hypothetical protein